jgi:hypothetical protein
MGVGHQMAAPKQAPLSGPKTGPPTVRAHSAPSPLVAPFWAPNADPILEPNPEIPGSWTNRIFKCACVNVHVCACIRANASE